MQFPTSIPDQTGLTLAEISRRYNLPYSRLWMLSLRLRLDPVRRVGNAALYAMPDVDRLVLESAAIDARKAGRQVGGI